VWCAVADRCVRIAKAGAVVNAAARKNACHARKENIKKTSQGESSHEFGD